MVIDVLFVLDQIQLKYRWNDNRVNGFLLIYLDDYTFWGKV